MFLRSIEKISLFSEFRYSELFFCGELRSIITDQFYLYFQRSEYLFLLIDWSGSWSNCSANRYQRLQFRGRCSPKLLHMEWILSTFSINSIRSFKQIRRSKYSYIGFAVARYLSRSWFLLTSSTETSLSSEEKLIEKIAHLISF